MLFLSVVLWGMSGGRARRRVRGLLGGIAPVIVLVLMPAVGATRRPMSCWCPMSCRCSIALLRGVPLLRWMGISCWRLSWGLRLGVGARRASQALGPGIGIEISLRALRWPTARR